MLISSPIAKKASGNAGGLFAISKKSLKNSHFEPPAQKAVFTKKSLKKHGFHPCF